jgi:inorganic triphosphatase YgiF
MSTKPVPTERELKFSLIDDVPSQEELRVVFKQAGFELVSQGTQKHFDVYFDDAEGSLRRAGIALRKRRAGGKALATLKANAKVSGELHEREELEELMLGNAWPDEIFKRVQEVIDPWNVKERLELDTKRSRYLVRRKGHDLAILSFDAVTANYPKVSDNASFEEVEIEALNDSSEQTLREIAEVLEQLIKLTPNSVNKLERAEALLSLSRSFQDPS